MLRKSFKKYLVVTYCDNWRVKSKIDKVSSDLSKDICVFSDYMWKAYQADWFEWHIGSTLFFWRWHRRHHVSVRDGVKVWSNGKPPHIRKQQIISSGTSIDLTKTKISNVRNKGYISHGQVKSLVRFIAVPKGTDDIRMVYDGT